MKVTCIINDNFKNKNSDDLKTIFVKFDYKYVAPFFVIAFSLILLNSCGNKSTSLADCSVPPDKIVMVHLDHYLGDVNVETQFYHPGTNAECGISMNDNLNREHYHRIIAALQPLLGFEENANVITKAVTIFIEKELDNDSLVALSNVAGINRYYTREGKLFHQLCIKKGNTFSEFKELTAEVDGVIFNYMHQIAIKVLKLNSHAIAFFIKTEDSKTLFKNLKHPVDELGRKLKIWIEKN